jgi:hypothetical protein
MGVCDVSRRLPTAGVDVDVDAHAPHKIVITTRATPVWQLQGWRACLKVSRGGEMLAWDVAVLLALLG